MNIQSFYRQEIKFVAGSSNIKNIPYLPLPEFAFIGKSNVGKSSLINSICNRKSLARVSHTPGRTQQINFFQIGNSCILVDLPGYGFAKVPVSMRKNWEILIPHYLSKRENLKIVNLLIDARRGIAEHDKAVIRLLRDFNKKFQIIFTKSDKISNHDLVAQNSASILATEHCDANIIFTSSRYKDGLKDLQISLVKAIYD